jgi:AraC-like DNA-binding protein
VTVIGVWPASARQSGPIATLLFCLSAAAWVLNESHPLASMPLHSPLVAVLAFPVPGLFWLFIKVVFEDEPLTAARLAPAALFLALGGLLMVTPDSDRGAAIAAFNFAAAIVCAHAGFVVLRGWRQDLVERRRALRGVILGAAAAFGMVEGVTGVLASLGAPGRWGVFAWPASYAVAAIAIALAAFSLQGRSALFPQRAPRAPDAALTPAEQALLAKLTTFMTGGGWRDEHLALTTLARDLRAPDKQLRRLINVALGHRNFAAFVNSYRVEAAKASLADASQAGKTVATIAFEVGYGSLSPFNRAFLAGTGKTPKAWRREALGSSY